MKFLLLTHIQNARQSLKASRTRSTLTMVGVTIGVASITIILALSSGASSVVGSQVNELGGNIAVIRPGAAATPLSSVENIQAQRSFSTSTLTARDVASIGNVPHVKAVAPLMILNGTIKGDSTAPNSSEVLATTSDFSRMSDISVNNGEFLNGDVGQNTAVIGMQMAINIFGTENCLGKTVTIRGTSFIVLGVLKMTNQPINYNNVDIDNAAIINLNQGQALNQGVAQIQQIDVKADSVTNLSGAIIQINKTILANHQNQADFSVLSGNQIAQPTSQLFYAIAGVSAAVAGISLLVGGIGIMNIMLVTVSERTREIGIRKALGASNSDIAWQFIIESLAISIGGGILGYLIGYGLAFAISTAFLTFNPSFDWQIAATAIGVSVVIGVIFGIYPAVRASKKDPIHSLRHFN